MLSPLIEQLISHLRCLPGVGPKSAQRMVFHLLQRARPAGLALAQSLTEAMEQVQHCQRCRSLSELPICVLCADTRRDARLLCVVETPADVMAIEQTHAYQGYYFVLMGHLSPLEGIGPQELGVKDFLARIKLLSNPESCSNSRHTDESKYRSQSNDEAVGQKTPFQKQSEVILATSSTVEGEATAHYLSELLKPYPLHTSRIAHGMPLGNELEFVDSNTLVRAMTARKLLNAET